MAPMAAMIVRMSKPLPAVSDVDAFNAFRNLRSAGDTPRIGFRIARPIAPAPRRLPAPCADHTRPTPDAAAASHGCNFNLNATTPGSSVDDTMKPLSFASEIIAAFSRSASPTIHAVPRERAYSMMRVISIRPSPLPF